MEINEQTYNGLQQYLLQTLNPTTQKEGTMNLFLLSNIYYMTH